MRVPVGFYETFVKPQVPPSFAPTPNQAPALSEDDRLVTFNSQGAKVIRLSNSGSYNFTKSKATEKKRTFDVARVHNSLAPSQFVDVEVVHRLKLRDALGNPMSRSYAKPAPRDNVEILQQNQTRSRT